MSPSAVEEEFDGAEVSADLSTITAMTRGEVDSQVVTAKRYPRSVSGFMKKAQEMACLSEEISESCMYALPRGGKTIEGPSARFAEIIASAWGNMRIEARPVDEGDRFVTSRGTSWDMETNVAVAFEVKRRITKSSGQRYDDDMIGVTTNAAGSIALRNAVLKNIPKAFWGPIYNAARKVAVGDATTLASRRAKMLEHFLKLGAANEQVLAFLKVAGVEDISLDHLGLLKGIATAIKDGDTSIENAFMEPASEGPKEPQRKANGDQKSETATGNGSAQHEARSRQMPSEPTGAVGGATPPAEATKAGPKKKGKDTTTTTPPAPVANTGPSVVMQHLVIIHTEYAAPAHNGAPAYYEIRGQVKAEGRAPEAYVFYTQDEALYKVAASCEGTETRFSLKWHGGQKHDGTKCKVLESIEAEN
jgi:hypothetical protein